MLVHSLISFFQRKVAIAIPLVLLSGAVKATSCTDNLGIGYTVGESPDTYTIRFHGLGQEADQEMLHTYSLSKKVGTGSWKKITDLSPSVLAFTDAPGAQISFKGTRVNNCSRFEGPCNPSGKCQILTFNLPSDNPPSVVAVEVVDKKAEHHLNDVLTIKATATDDWGMEWLAIYARASGQAEVLLKKCENLGKEATCSISESAVSMNLGGGTYDVFARAKDYFSNPVESTPDSITWANQAPSISVSAPLIDQRIYEQDSQLNIEFGYRAVDNDTYLKDVSIYSGAIASQNRVASASFSGQNLYQKEGTLSWQPFALDPNNEDVLGSLPYYYVVTNEDGLQHQTQIQIQIKSRTAPGATDITRIDWDGKSSSDTINTSGELKLWFAPGDKDTQGYKLYCSGSCNVDPNKDDALEWPRIYSNVSGAELQMLSSGEATFCLKAYNSAGESTEQGACQSVTVSLAAPVATAFNNSLMGIKDGQSGGTFTLAWSASTRASEYKLWEKKTGTEQWQLTYQGTELSHVVSGKALGDYSYRIDTCSDTGKCTAGQEISVLVAKPVVTNIAPANDGVQMVLTGLNLDPLDVLKVQAKSMNGLSTYEYPANQLSMSGEALYLNAGSSDIHQSLYNNNGLGAVITLTNANGENTAVNAYGNRQSAIISLGDAPPLVTNDTVFVGVGTQLHALDAATGEPLLGWPYLTDGDILARPTQDAINQNIYIGSTDDYLHAVQLNGDRVWRTKTGGDIVSSPVVDYTDSSIYVGSLDRALYAFDRISGAIQWQYPLPGGVSQSPSLYGNGLIYVTTDDGQLHSINRNSLGPAALIWDDRVNSDLAEELANTNWTPTQVHEVHVYRVSRLLLGILGRTPTRPELTYWTYQHYNGQALVDIATSFLNSSEGQARFAAISNDDYQGFLDILFEGMFPGKDAAQVMPDGQTLEQWKALMGQGMSRAQVAVHWTESLEYITRINSLVDTALDFYYDLCLLSQGCASDTDSDLDGIGDLEELEGGTDPNNTDTDGDDVPDGSDAAPNVKLPLPPAINAQSQVVGSLGGSGQVTPQGAFVYSIPVSIPAGIGDLTPKLSLDYNSQGPNSPMGVGWSLGGLSSAQRCNTGLDADNIIQGVEFTSQDALCLDGQRLMLISGTNLTPGAEYRTEIESFKKVVVESGEYGLSLKVFHLNGTVWSYGTRQDAMLTDSTTGEAYIWYLSKVEDFFGNVIEYSYLSTNTAKASELDARNFPVISEITYGGNTIYFNYSDDRRDFKSSFILTNKFVQDRRLNSIVVVNHEDIEVHNYALSYNQTHLNQRTLVQKIELCQANKDLVSACLPPTEFDYGDNELEIYFEEGKPTSGYVFNPISGNNSLKVERVTPVDVNGDGLSDLVKILKKSGTDYYVTVQINDGQRLTLNHNMSFHVSTDGRDVDDIALVQFADLDNNGTIDFVTNFKQKVGSEDPQSWSIRYNFQDNSQLTLNLDNPKIDSDLFYLADFNGDGWSDLVYAGCDGLCIRLNTGIDESNASDQSGSARFGRELTFFTQYDALEVLLEGEDLSDFNMGPAGDDIEQTLEMLFSNVRHMPLQLDFNADGQAELMARFKYQRKVHAGNSDETNELKYFFHPLYIKYNQDETWTVSVRSLFRRGKSLYTSLHRAMAGDINGDGNTDLIEPIVMRDFDSSDIEDTLTYYRTHQGTGKALKLSGDYSTRTQNVNYNTLLDFNHDGMADLIFGIQDSLLPEESLGTTALEFARSTGEGFALPSWSQAIKYSPADDDYITFMDFDNNGYVDLILGNKGSAEETVYLNQSSNTLDVIKGVRDNGKNLSVEYGRLTDASVYTKGSGASSKQWGRCRLNNSESPQCAAVLDVISPAQVVKTLTLDSATDKNGLTLTRSTGYHYKGLRVQSAGRGSLGFETVIKTDNDTQITTTTDYYQAYPYTGMVKQASTHYFNGSESILLSQTSATPATLSLNDNKNRFVYVDNKESYTYQLNVEDGILATAHTSVSKTEVDVDYEVRGAIGAQYPVKTHSVEKMIDYLEGGKSYTTSTTSEYEQENIDNWFIARTTKTTAVHTSGSETVTRVVAMEYDPTTGVLLKEEKEPDEDVTLNLRTFHNYDEFGNKTSTTLCSNHYSDIECKDETVLPSTIDDLYKVYRRDFVRFDSEGRYIVAKGSNDLITEKYSKFTAYGKPQRIDDATTQSVDDQSAASFNEVYYDAFGKEYFRRAADGSHSQITYAYCHQQSECPKNAFSYVETSGEGMPIKRIYKDIAGREVRSQVQGFDEGSWILVDQRYNKLGHLTEKSIPYFKGQEPQFGINEYDVFGRMIKGTAVDGTVTQTDIQAGKVIAKVKGTYSGTGWGAVVDQSSSKTINAREQVIGVADNLSNELSYTFDVMGNLRTTTGVDGEVITAHWDAFGRRIGLDDPDKGNWRYTYNAMGEMVTSTGPDAVITEEYRDNFGRVVKRLVTKNGSGIETSRFEFDGVRLSREYTSFGPSRTYAYDVLGRRTETTHNLGGITRTTVDYYDHLGRVYKHKDASGKTTKTLFNARGHVLATLDGLDHDLSDGFYTRIDEMDARGNVTEYTLGNQITTAKEFDVKTGYLKNITSGLAQSLVYEFDGIGNLRSRQDLANVNALGNTQATQEIFTYDDMNRLHTVTGTNTLSLSYYANGGIKTKSDVQNGAVYHYGTQAAQCSSTGAAHALTQVGSLSYCYDIRGNQTHSYDGANLVREVTYGHFDKPTRIWSDKATTDFSYDTGRMRYKRVDNKEGETTTTWYIGNVEILQKSGGAVEYKRYIGDALQTLHASGLGATEFTQVKTQYLHKDHLGSIHVITNEQGELQEQLSFDAFGHRRSNPGWNPVQDLFAELSFGRVLDSDFITQKGFTGHEHIDHANVIHMNGRIYDPVVGRFMQADPYMQAPEHSQGLNRYSYVMNNPLSYTDPSGYFIKGWGKGVIRQIAVHYLHFAINAVVPGLGTALYAMYTAYQMAQTVVALHYAMEAGNLAGALLNMAATSAMYMILDHMTGVQQLEQNVMEKTLPSEGYKLYLASLPQQAKGEDGSGGKVEADGHTSHVKFDENGDPIPDLVIDIARDTKLGLKMKDGKLTTSIDWACNGGKELCNQSMKYFDEVVSINSDFLDISNNLTSDYSSADAYLNFTNNDSPFAGGNWNNSVKVITINRNSIALKRALQHEYGHSLGLFHRSNDTMNFMSYYGLGSTYHYIAPKINEAQRGWLKDAYTPWYKFW